MFMLSGAPPHGVSVPSNVRAHTHTHTTFGHWTRCLRRLNACNCSNVFWRSHKITFYCLTECQWRAVACAVVRACARTLANQFAVGTHEPPAQVRMQNRATTQSQLHYTFVRLRIARRAFRPFNQSQANAEVSNRIIYTSAPHSRARFATVRRHTALICCMQMWLFGGDRRHRSKVSMILYINDIICTDYSDTESTLAIAPNWPDRWRKCRVLCQINRCYLEASVIGWKLYVHDY